MQKRTQFVFNCPIHGEETVLFCFRATDPDLKQGWRKFELTREELPISPEEVREIQAQLSGPRRGI